MPRQLHTPLPFRADYARLDLCSYPIGNTLDQVPPFGVGVMVGSCLVSVLGQSSAARFHRRSFRDAGSTNAEGRLRFPSAAFRDVELNVLNYRRSSTSRVAIGLPPRSLLKMEWTFVGRRDH